MAKTRTLTHTIRRIKPEDIDTLDDMETYLLRLEIDRWDHPGEIGHDRNKASMFLMTYKSENGNIHKTILTYGLN